MTPCTTVLSLIVLDYLELNGTQRLGGHIQRIHLRETLIYRLLNEYQPHEGFFPAALLLTCGIVFETE